MTYYSIDSGDGDNICSGISELRVDAIAREYAADLGAPVYVYSSDGEEEYMIDADGEISAPAHSH